MTGDDIGWLVVLGVALFLVSYAIYKEIKNVFN